MGQNFYVPRRKGPHRAKPPTHDQWVSWLEEENKKGGVNANFSGGKKVPTAAEAYKQDLRQLDTIKREIQQVMLELAQDRMTAIVIHMKVCDLLNMKYETPPEFVLDRLLEMDLNEQAQKLREAFQM